MATGAHADEITAALKPTVSKDINSGVELTNAFGWFRDMLSTRPGKYGEIYQLWRGHPAARGWSAQPWGPDDDRLLDELSGIDFGPLFGEAQRFANLRGATEELRLGAESMRSRLHDAWSGPAGQAAVDTFDQLGKASSVFRDMLNQFAAALDLARLTAREAIVNVQQSQIRRFDLSNGVEFRREQIRRIDAAMAGQQPFGRPRSAEELHRPNTVDLNSGSWEIWWSNEAIKTLDTMCDSYANAVEPLRKLLTGTTTAITDAWAALDDALRRIRGGNLDPFGGVKAAPPGTTSPSGAEKVTIDDGQRRITTERDAQGRLSMTVDHPGAAQNLTSQPPPPGPAGTPPAGDGGSGRPGSGGGGSGGGGGSAGGGGGAESAAAQPNPEPGTMMGAQQPSGSQEPQPAHAAAAPGGAAPPGGGGGMGGMPMGGMGAGGGQGGDQERKASRWRIQGDLLDDAAPEVVPVVIGDVDPYEKNQKGRK